MILSGEPELVAEVTDGWIRDATIDEEHYRLIREMAQIYSGNLFFGEDLMEIPVQAPAPRKLD